MNQAHRHMRLHVCSTSALTENGCEEYGWRVLDGVPRLLVTRISFTLRGDERETFEAFKGRMLTFATLLTEECDYVVTSLQINRRASQNKTPWAEFDCLTPEDGLPRRRTTNDERPTERDR